MRRQLQGLRDFFKWKPVRDQFFDRKAALRKQGAPIPPGLPPRRCSCREFPFLPRRRRQRETRCALRGSLWAKSSTRPPGRASARASPTRLGLGHGEQDRIGAAAFGAAANLVAQIHSGRIEGLGRAESHAGGATARHRIAGVNRGALAARQNHQAAGRWDPGR